MTTTSHPSHARRSERGHRRGRVATATCLLIALTLSPGPADAAMTTPGDRSVITQPTQPSSGPGGARAAHRGMKVSRGGVGSRGWYVFEPTRPRLRSAPVAVITHGYFEFSGYEMHRSLIEHTVRRGTIVIYPRYQTTPATACPGPYDIEPCLAVTAGAIKDALTSLRSNPARTQPNTSRTSYFGFSFGGIITANLTNRWRALGLPRPRVVFLDDPHDGGFTGNDEPALDDDLSGIPTDALVQCHVGASGVISERGKANASCNAVFPRLAHIPARRKDLVLSYDDAHGSPALSSAHGVSTGGGRRQHLGAPGAPGAPPDAYDHRLIWKIWDALRDHAFTGRNGRYALGNTPEHRSHGRWSDGTPVRPLKIQDRAPIRP